MAPQEKSKASLALLITPPAIAAGEPRTAGLGGLQTRLDLGVRRDFRPAGSATWGIRFSGRGGSVMVH